MADKEKDKDLTISNISVDSEGQLQFDDIENYFPVASDYGRIPRPFIERYTNVSYLANLGLMLAIQNIESRNKNFYLGTAEEAYFKEIYKKTKTDYSDGLISCIPISKFISIYGLNRGGSTYASLDSLYNGDALRSQWQILYEDDNIISGTNVLTGTMYDKKTKCLYMKFNPDLAPIITNIQKNYALISLPVLGKLKEDYITQLYQILKEKFDFEESKNRKYKLSQNREIEIEYDLDKLLFMMGMYPLDLTSPDPGMQMAAQQVRAQNYREAAQILREQHLIEKNISEAMHIKALNDFRDFSRVYLTKCFTRINGFKKPAKLENIDSDGWDEAFAKYAALCREKHPTDIHFRYSYRRGGLGGKVNAVIFYVSRADWSKEDAVYTIKEPGETKGASEPISDEQYEIIDEIHDLIKEKISIKGLTEIGRASGWDIEKVKTAYEVACNYGKQINDLVAFMIKAVTEGWEPAVKTEDPELEDYCEEYPLEELKQRLGFKDVIHMHPDFEEPLSYFMDVIYEAMNSDASSVKIGNGRLPAQTVKERLLQLNAFDLSDAIAAFLNGTESRNVTSGYILTILYNIRLQEGLKRAKALHRNEGLYETSEMPVQKASGKKQANPAGNTAGRRHTKKELEQLEKKKLGIKDDK